MARRAALIARPLLLLFDHFVEARLLLGRQNGAKVVSCALEFFPDFRIHGLHHFLDALLAARDDLVRLLALLRC